MFLASLSSFPVFHQYTLLFTATNGAIAQQTFEAYAAYVLGQHTNILAHSTLRPFAGNIEGYEDGASEDVGMGGDLVCPTPPTHFYTQYPTANAMLPYYQQPNHILPTNFYPPPPGLGFNPYPNPPIVNGFYPIPPCPCTGTLRQERQQTARQETRQERPDTA